MLKNFLIIGGTSGLSLELAKQYTALGHTVFVTGRKNPKIDIIHFIPFTITSNIQETIQEINTMVQIYQK